MANRRLLFPVATMLCAMTVPAIARGQAYLTPMIGGYVPAGSVTQAATGSQTIATTRDGTLSLGANLEFPFHLGGFFPSGLIGPLRGSLAYVSGSTIKDANRQNIGKGNMFAAAGDVVIFPLARILVQPYLLAGAGEKFYTFDQSSTLVLGTDQRHFAWHGGVGADMMLGSVGVVAEVTDFLSQSVYSKWNVHDAFVMVGMKFALP